MRGKTFPVVFIITWPPGQEPVSSVKSPDTNWQKLLKFIIDVLCSSQSVFNVIMYNCSPGKNPKQVFVEEQKLLSYFLKITFCVTTFVLFFFCSDASSAESQLSRNNSKVWYFEIISRKVESRVTGIFEIML